MTRDEDDPDIVVRDDIEGTVSAYMTEEGKAKLRAEGARAALALTPETCDALAEMCRSGKGEQSLSRYHALARASLQSAADWLRRAKDLE